MCSTLPRKARSSPRRSRNSSAKCSKERWFRPFCSENRRKTFLLIAMSLRNGFFKLNSAPKTLDASCEYNGDNEWSRAGKTRAINEGKKAFRRVLRKGLTLDYTPGCRFMERSQSYADRHCCENDRP